jgi:adenylylsulfate kinase
MGMGIYSRRESLHHMAWVVWFTGLPGCGKTTIAEKTKALLSENGIESRTLQLDEIRRVITPHPRYTDEEREIVYASLAYMAKLLSDAGVNVIVDATANRRSYRDLARGMVPSFAEVYIKAPLDVCISREAVRKARFAPKDIYKKAATEKAAVPGVNVSYEEPLNAEIIVDSAEISPEKSAQLIARRIMEIFGKG